MNPISAMVSYSWNDADAAELLHTELALRGFSVFHDRCSFPVGERLGQNMADAVRTCDAFIAYLTDSSLYVGTPTDSPRPALDDEFKPIMARWRSGKAAPSTTDPPIVIPLTHGLGDPRTEAPERVRRASGEDIGSLWTPIVLDQGTATITQAEAASVGRSLIGGVLTSDRRPGMNEPIEVVLTTRGEGQAPALITIDATPLLGGADNRPGAPDDWARFLAGLKDLQAATARWTRERRLHVLPRAHLTACLAFGRIFNQAAGWQPVVSGRFGETGVPPGHPGHPDLRVVLDRTGGRDDLTVEIDLVGGNVTELANGAISEFDHSPCARLQVTRHGQSDLSAADVGAMAGATADAIREHVASLRPERVHIFCASPAEFAVLLGNRLTSLHADLLLYERDGDHYVRSLHISRATA